MSTFTILKYDKTGKRNSLGQIIHDFQESGSFDGWIDFLGGEESNSQNAITADSTHIIITFETSLEISISDRIRFKNRDYEVTYVDNPMELDDHLEIFLKAVG